MGPGNRKRKSSSNLMAMVPRGDSYIKWSEMLVASLRKP